MTFNVRKKALTDPACEDISVSRSSDTGVESKRIEHSIDAPPFVPIEIDNGTEIDIESDDELAAAEATFASKITTTKKVLLALGLVGIFLISFALGRYPVSPLELIQNIWWHFTDPTSIINPQIETVIFNIRFPRVIVVLLAGAALSVAGASYQGMFKNPLVSPDLLGASAGASLGACLALLLGLSSIMIQAFAFVGGMMAVGLAVWMNKLVKYDPILGLVLGGILVSTLFQSGTSLVKYVADANDKLPTITFWLMGSFASVNQRDLFLALIPMLIGFALLLSQSWKLNVMSFGEEEARSMGVNTRTTRLIVILASTLLTSTSVAIAGVVGWIGLVIPHLGRALVGPNYRVLLPVTMVLGASYLLIVDNIARLVASVEIPIGILTSILGVPFFIVIFRHNMRGWK